MGRQLLGTLAAVSPRTPLEDLLHFDGAEAPVRTGGAGSRGQPRDARAPLLPSGDDSQRSASRQGHGPDPTGNGARRSHTHPVRESGQTHSAGALCAPRRADPALAADLVEGAGHMLLLEAPARVNQEVL